MLPKKIYLNGGDENAVTICSREPITRSYGNTHSREYTDLSQVWHPATEIPTEKETILLAQEKGKIFVIEYGCQAIYKRIVSWEKVFKMYEPVKWAYANDLLPKEDRTTTNQDNE